MRKLIYGGAAAFLVTAACGVYVAMHTDRTEPAPSFADEEQDGTQSASIPLGDLVYHTPSRQEEPEFGVELTLQSPTHSHRFDNLADTQVEPRAPIEPIVVTSPVPELPPVTEVGGALAPGEGFGTGVVNFASAPRPDLELGQGPIMPYVADNNNASWLATRLWAALYRVLSGEAPAASGAEETPEPPLAVTEPAVLPRTETLLPLFPAGIDHQYHQQCCPYTGRCPLPYHPAPPPGPGRE